MNGHIKPKIRRARKWSSIEYYNALADGWMVVIGNQVEHYHSWTDARDAAVHYIHKSAHRDYVHHIDEFVKAEMARWYE